MKPYAFPLVRKESTTFPRVTSLYSFFQQISVDFLHCPRQYQYKNTSARRELRALWKRQTAKKIQLP